MLEEIQTAFSRTRTLHHAYGIEGSWDAVRESIEHFLVNHVGVAVTANPDVQFLFVETLGIDESRNLEGAAQRKAYAPVGKFFITGCQTLTHEAQNALLKLFEDPPAQTTFFLIVPSHAQLLPTLRSRLYLVSGQRSDTREQTTSAQAFLAAAPGVRMSMLTEIVENKNREEAVRLINALEVSLCMLPHSNERTEAVKQIYMVRKYILDRASSLKLLLEHLAITLPVIAV